MQLPTGAIALNVTQEKAFELAAELTESHRHETGHTTIVRGMHSVMGELYIVIANITDEAVVLPIASQLSAL